MWLRLPSGCLSLFGCLRISATCFSSDCESVTPPACCDTISHGFGQTTSTWNKPHSKRFSDGARVLRHTNPTTTKTSKGSSWSFGLSGSQLAARRRWRSAVQIHMDSFGQPSAKQVLIMSLRGQALAILQGMVLAQSAVWVAKRVAIGSRDVTAYPFGF